MSLFPPQGSLLIQIEVARSQIRSKFFQQPKGPGNQVVKELHKVEAEVPGHLNESRLQPSTQAFSSRSLDLATSFPGSLSSASLVVETLGMRLSTWHEIS